MSELTAKRLVWVLLCATFPILLGVAWISDDAAISLRTVLNTLHGDGPVFNVGERVQAYTHPLWFALLVTFSAILGNIFTATFVVSIGTALGFVALFLATAGSDRRQVLAIGLLLLLSRAFLDFSVSGLENPLSHLLILGVVLLSRQSDRHLLSPVAAFFMIALLWLNRPDLILLFVPLGFWHLWQLRHRPAIAVVAILSGAVPILVWSAFSLWYYGFPFPNTAYAKLGSGIESTELALRGLTYFRETLLQDPVTLLVVFAGLLIGLAGPARERALALGIGLYLVYLVRIGGDFMLGRFFTPPFVLSAIILAAARLPKLPSRLGFGALAVLGLPALLAVWRVPDPKSGADLIKHGNIVDERAFYYPLYGLLAPARMSFSQPDWSAGERHVIVQCGFLGFTSIAAGRSTHVIDDCGLADALLARLPAREARIWGNGHFVRQLPTNYYETVRDRANQLADPEVAAFYERLVLVTQAPLGTSGRWQTIVDLNLGRIGGDFERYKTTTVPRSTGPVLPGETLTGALDGAAWDAVGTVIFAESLTIGFDRGQIFNLIDISVSGNDSYLVEAETPTGWASIAVLQPGTSADLTRRLADAPMLLEGITGLRITGSGGDGNYSLGHLRLYHREDGRIILH